MHKQAINSLQEVIIIERGRFMGKLEKQKSNIILYAGYFVILLALSMLVEIGNADDIIKYWAHRGCAPD